MVEEALPGVGVFDALGAEAVGGPLHVGQEMGGLHGGDDAFSCEAVEVAGEQDLGVFDAEAEGGGGGGPDRGGGDDVGVGAVVVGWWGGRLATCSAAPKALRAMSLARSPMAWKPSWKPAAARSEAIWLSLSCS